jgi:hypothetical protein
VEIRGTSVPRNVNYAGYDPSDVQSIILHSNYCMINIKLLNMTADTKLFIDNILVPYGKSVNKNRYTVKDIFHLP